MAWKVTLSTWNQTSSGQPHLINSSFSCLSKPMKRVTGGSTTVDVKKNTMMINSGQFAPLKCLNLGQILGNYLLTLIRKPLSALQSRNCLILFQILLILVNYTTVGKMCTKKSLQQFVYLLNFLQVTWLDTCNFSKKVSWYKRYVNATSFHSTFYNCRIKYD